MKQLFICENHHHVLHPWAKVRRTNEELNLLTFDQHTDTHDAFLMYSHNHEGESSDSLIDRIDIHNDDTISEAIKNLRNDEHIDTAIKCNIFRKVFVVSHNGSSDQPPSNEWSEIFEDQKTEILFLTGKLSLPEIQTYPDSNLYIIGTSEKLNDCNGISDNFISLITSRIQVVSGIDITKTSYILDIDLDYFHSYAALNRDDIKLFCNLLSQATAITIATEPAFAWEGMDSEIILSKIITLAKRELGDNLKIIDLRKLP